jgi:quercetin dioxygenase-like cupin family protein
MHAPEALTALGRITSERCDVTVVTREPMVVPPHAHDTTNHVLVTEGCLWLTMGGAERPVHAGDWCCIPAGTEHAERFAERTSAVVFWLRDAN